MLKTACGNGFPLNIPSVIPESGGSGGTSDYSELSNKPKINSVTLSGNKSAADLGLASADIEDLIPADASSSNQLATAADLPGLATTSAPGLVQPDGTTVTIEDGVISAVGGGSTPVDISAKIDTTVSQVGTVTISYAYRVGSICFCGGIIATPATQSDYSNKIIFAFDTDIDPIISMRTTAFDTNAKLLIPYIDAAQRIFRFTGDTVNANVSTALNFNIYWII